MPRRKADYPDWVMKYKTKGTYINRAGDRYYLYAAHSERIKGTDKVRRVSDGYIGRITKEDGLIKARNKFKSAPESFEVGLSFPVIHMSQDILLGLKKSYRKNGELIYCCSVLSFIYKKYSPELYDSSYVSIRFPGIQIPAAPAPAVTTGIERGHRMLEDTVSRHMAEDYPLFLALFPDIRLVKIDGIFYLSGLRSDLATISDNHGIRWEDESWQR